MVKTMGVDVNHTIAVVLCTALHGRSTVMNRVAHSSTARAELTKGCSW